MRAILMAVLAFMLATSQASAAEGFCRVTQVPVQHPARVDKRVDPKLRKAAAIAQDHASYRHSRKRCWRYVKLALVKAGVVWRYPTTPYAKQAGDELMRSFGFVRLSIRDPYAAPLGAVVVYNNGDAGHVELRTQQGFASDYWSPWRCKYPVTGVYVR